MDVGENRRAGVTRVRCASRAPSPQATAGHRLRRSSPRMSGLLAARPPRTMRRASTPRHHCIDCRSQRTADPAAILRRRSARSIASSTSVDTRMPAMRRSWRGFGPASVMLSRHLALAHRRDMPPSAARRRDDDLATIVMMPRTHVRSKMAAHQRAIRPRRRHHAAAAQEAGVMHTVMPHMHALVAVPAAAFRSSAP